MSDAYRTDPPICGDSHHRHDGPCEVYANRVDVSGPPPSKPAPGPPPRPRPIGPPPAGPLMCFRCTVGSCGHSASTRASDAHGGGLIPAITMKDGTALCLDCAFDAD